MLPFVPFAAGVVVGAVALKWFKDSKAAKADAKTEAGEAAAPPAAAAEPAAGAPDAGQPAPPAEPTSTPGSDKPARAARQRGGKPA